MRLRDRVTVERSELGEYLCPDCTTPFPSSMAAASCDCDTDVR